MTRTPSPAVTTLLAKLSLEQKIAQLSGMMATDLLGAPTQPNAMYGLLTERLAEIRPHGVGHISMAWFYGNDAETLAADLEKVQAATRELTPFGIGALVHVEGINGFLHRSGPQFPTSWAQAATWSPDLASRATAVTAAHMRRTGMHLVFSPVMDLSRDPRWGRVHETYGEDTELVSQFSVAFVSGIQSSAEAPEVLATAKHFVGYGASEGGLNQAITQLGVRALTDEYAEPFRRAIRDAGLSVIMNSYNEIDGVPAVSNRWLLTDLLREQLGFEGLVVSDYDAVNLLHTVYHTASTPGQAAAQSLEAGLDNELPGNVNFSFLTEEVESGRLDESVIDTAVARVLTIKERVGLLPGVGRKAVAASYETEAADVRREIADKALVLLKNDGTLPLEPGAQRIVVVGPGADELRIHFGAYTSVSDSEMQIGSAALFNNEIPGIDPASFNFTDIFQARMPGIEDRFERATQSIHPDSATVLQALRTHDSTVEFVELGSFESAEPIDRGAIQDVVSAANVVIAVVGERTGWVGNNTAGEGQTSAVLELPGNQNDLIAAIAETGSTLVTVLISGRPLIVSAQVAASNAVLLAPLLGQEGGPTIASAVFGELNPSGKLPSTFPRTIGQVPMYHGHHYGSGYDHPTGSRHGYNDVDHQLPLFEFGHGLSYSTFSTAFEGDPADAVTLIDGTIRARVLVTNTSSRDGEIVVQLYARDEEASIVRPVRQLLAFKRVSVAADTSVSLTLEAPLERLAYTQLDGRRGLEAGTVAIMVAQSSRLIDGEVSITVPSIQL